MDDRIIISKAMQEYYLKLEYEKQRDIAMIQKLMNENKELKKKVRRE